MSWKMASSSARGTGGFAETGSPAWCCTRVATIASITISRDSYPLWRASFDPAPGPLRIAARGSHPAAQGNVRVLPPGASIRQDLAIVIHHVLDQVSAADDTRALRNEILFAHVE